MPKCGNCHENHETVLMIRECYGNVATPPINTQGAGGPMWPPSAKQLDYLEGLMADKELPSNYTTQPRADWAKVERDQVSAEISLLKSFPWKDRRASDVQPKEYTMVEGRYALIDDDNVWRFYEVSRSDKPRWKGYTFIKRLIGAPGQYRKDAVQVTRERYRILDIIEVNQRKAMTDYGLQSGVCGKCSSPLSDPDSLARGMGPICAGKMGWF